YMMSQLFPGADPDTSVTVQTFLAVGEVDDERAEQIDKMMAFLDHVVRDEDYYTGNGIQAAVKTQIRKDFLFGRNETGGQRFHSWIEALVNTSDDDLKGLFERGVPLPGQE
ncbi:MAG: SRPBCC family protein, partial [Acidimicrobiales bacterium]